MSSPAPMVVKIPNELLVEIFRLALDNRSSRCNTRTTIQLVCRRWRRVLLESKFLWSKIVIDVKHAADEMPPWNGYALSEFIGPDMSYITQCLMIAHGHPLDITISVRVTVEYEEATISSMREALGLLHLHAIRWRSLSCSAPWWFYDHGSTINKFFDDNCLPMLEKLSLSGTARVGDPLLSIARANITLPPSLRHLNLNFSFPHFDVTWSNLTSFVGGFDSNTEFFDLLPRMVALHTLHLTHLRLLQAAAPSQSIITLKALRHLKLSQCAVQALSFIAVDLRFPEVKEFSLLTRSEPHVRHTAGVCVTTIVGADMVDPLCRILERSGAVIGIFNLDLEHSLSYAFVVRLCTKLGATVHSLRVKFSFGYRRQEIMAFLDMLTVRPSAQPLFPRLLELELVGFNQIWRSDQLFKGPALEMLVVSRWSDGKDPSTRLQTLRLRRVRFRPALDTSYEASSHSLAKLSLAATLRKLRSEGLDVQWFDEFMHEPYYDLIPADVDILQDIQQYRPVDL